MASLEITFAINLKTIHEEQIKEQKHRQQNNPLPW